MIQRHLENNLCLGNGTVLWWVNQLGQTRCSNNIIPKCIMAQTPQMKFICLPQSRVVPRVRGDWRNERRGCKRLCLNCHSRTEPAEALLSLTHGFGGHLNINTETAEMDRTQRNMPERVFKRPGLIVRALFLLTFHWLELSELTTPNCKGGLETQASRISKKRRWIFGQQIQALPQRITINTSRIPDFQDLQSSLMIKPLPQREDDIRHIPSAHVCFLSRQSRGEGDWRNVNSFHTHCQCPTLCAPVSQPFCLWGISEATVFLHPLYRITQKHREINRLGTTSTNSGKSRCTLRHILPGFSVG